MDVSQTSTIGSIAKEAGTYMDFPSRQFNKRSGQSTSGEAHNGNTFLTILSIGRKL
jgi:hypothetical protein